MSIVFAAVLLRSQRPCPGEARSERNDGWGEWDCSQTTIKLMNKRLPQKTRQIAVVIDKSAIGIVLKRQSPMSLWLCAQYGAAGG